MGNRRFSRKLYPWDLAKIIQLRSGDTTYTDLEISEAAKELLIMHEELLKYVTRICLGMDINVVINEEDVSDVCLFVMFGNSKDKTNCLKFMCPPKNVTKFRLKSGCDLYTRIMSGKFDDALLNILSSSPIYAYYQNPLSLLKELV